jgi:hypothetical protein
MILVGLDGSAIEIRWTAEKIVEHFDGSNITLKDLSYKCGWSMTELKKLLQKEDMNFITGVTT